MSAGTSPELLESEAKDDLLRRLFACADRRIPIESQLAFVLKTIPGFSAEQIATRLCLERGAVLERLQCARARVPEREGASEITNLDALVNRLPCVLELLYELFNEGYRCGQPDEVMRREVCEESLRLTRLLVGHPAFATPEADALLALMYLHSARGGARAFPMSDLLLLEEPDRSTWDAERIALGVFYLHRATRGELFSRYHAEAAIAAEHCIAPSYERTRWDEIARLYEMLDAICPSPLNALYGAIAVAEWKGVDFALNLLGSVERPRWLLEYHLWDATLGELYRRRGDHDLAVVHLTRALEAASTHAERAHVERRLCACSANE